MKPDPASSLDRGSSCWFERQYPHGRRRQMEEGAPWRQAGVRAAMTRPAAPVLLLALARGTVLVPGVVVKGFASVVEVMRPLSGLNGVQSRLQRSRCGCCSSPSLSPNLEAHHGRAERCREPHTAYTVGPVIFLLFQLPRQPSP